jgi:hypothetical protein
MVWVTTAGDNPGSDPGIAWRNAADRLAAWAERFVNRWDCWGGYRPPEEWGRPFTRPDGTTGELGQTTTRKGQLVRGVLVRHFRGRCRADLMGLHSTAPNNTSRWGAVDVDWHGSTSTAPAINLRAAMAWYGVLVGMGFHPLLVDSNGKGGFHLWALVAGVIPTSRLYHFLRRLVADHARHGMAVPPETFPKQPEVRSLPDGRPGYGNWLRLLGKHHTSNHWSRVWDGVRWLDGAAAVDYVLSRTGDPPSLIPDMSPPVAPLVRPHRHVSCGEPRGNLSARIAAYLRRLPNLAAGQGRDDVAYHFAAFLAIDLDLADDVCLAWLERWDSGNCPPKGEARLAEILANARRYGRNAVGCGRSSPAPRRRHRGHRFIILRASVEVE